MVADFFERLSKLRTHREFPYTGVYYFFFAIRQKDSSSFVVQVGHARPPPDGPGHGGRGHGDSGGGHDDGGGAGERGLCAAAGKQE